MLGLYIDPVLTKCSIFHSSTTYLSVCMGILGHVIGTSHKYSNSPQILQIQDPPGNLWALQTP